LKILFVTSEAFPLIKTGGLADVSGSLPNALKKLNVDIRLLIPGYPAVIEALGSTEKIATINHLPEIGQVNLLLGKMPDTKVPVIVIQSAPLFEREGNPYVNALGNDWPDNALRFGILSKVAAILANKKKHIIDWQPDIVHCNDWQSGLAPAYMKLIEHSKTKSVMSIHNMAFQGNFPPQTLNLLQLPPEHFVMEGLEYHGQLSFLKAGLYYADAISTVSPRYAFEIQTTAFGFGLEGLLSKRSHEITGILNGIEPEEWNPKNDSYICENYSVRKLANKKLVKTALQTRLGLNVNADAPLLGIVSRLTYQKGLDMLLPIMPDLLNQGCQFALLGSGDFALEQAFSNLASQYPQQVAVNIGYNEPLSHQIMAGVDMFIMPSRFEPCGLNQLYGLTYGTPPIVNATGGLADSIIDTNENSLKNKTANGFVMSEANANALLSTIQRAVQVYKESPKIWQQIQKNGMSLNLSWDSSAQKYLAMYEKLLAN
jgi:starch synthase